MSGVKFWFWDLKVSSIQTRNRRCQHDINRRCQHDINRRCQHDINRRCQHDINRRCQHDINSFLAWCKYNKQTLYEKTHNTSNLSQRSPAHHRQCSAPQAELPVCVRPQRVWACTVSTLFFLMYLLSMLHYSRQYYMPFQLFTCVSHFLLSHIVYFLIITPLQCFKVYWFNKRAERLMVLIYKVLFTCWPGSYSLY